VNFHWEHYFVGISFGLIRADVDGLICLSVERDFFLSSIKTLVFNFGFDVDGIGLKLISRVKKTRGENI
jgi:hypothetical protein